MKTKNINKPCENPLRKSGLLHRLVRYIPDGIYDNSSNGYREAWIDGKIVSCSKAIIYSGKNRDKRSKQWGHYPDIPNESDKQ